MRVNVLIYYSRLNNSLHKVLSEYAFGRGHFIWRSSEHEKILCIISMNSMLSLKTSSQP